MSTNDGFTVPSSPSGPQNVNRRMARELCRNTTWLLAAAALGYAVAWHTFPSADTGLADTAVSLVPLIPLMFGVMWLSLLGLPVTVLLVRTLGVRSGDWRKALGYAALASVVALAMVAGAVTVLTSVLEPLWSRWPH